VRGFEAVNQTMERAAALYRDGRAVGFGSPNMSARTWHTSSRSRFEAKMGGRDDISPVSLRCTSIFRREDGDWNSCIATPTRHAAGLIP
jgi:hypothetical protein